MIPVHERHRWAVIGIFLTALIAFFPGHTAAQQQPISIDDWLRSERDNANMQRAVEQYEQAKYGTVTRQPTPAPNTYLPQPSQPRNTYGPEQAQLPGTDAAPQAPVPGGELPQRPNQQNTYKVPDNALQKIEKQYSRDELASGNTNTGTYIAGHIGWDIVPSQDYGAAGTADFSLLGFQASGAVGHKFDKGLSLELLGSYQHASYDERNVDGGVSMYALLANAKMEFEIRQPYAPYVSAGLGAGYHVISDANVASSSASLDDSALVLAYQFGAGVMYPLSERTTIDVGYRYFGTTPADMSSAAYDFTAEFSSHSFMIGVQHQL